MVAAIIGDAHAAVEGIFSFVKSERQLTTSYIKELHSLLLRNQRTRSAMTPAGEMIELPVERGVYKTEPNNPMRDDGSTHYYCPPVHVAAEMDRLVQLHADHIARGVPPEVEAAWLHHRFTQIHPFSDGNGRVARLLASAVFLKAGWFPVEISRDGVAQYIDALERADEGILLPLVSLFARCQRIALIEVLDARDRADPPATVGDAVAKAIEVLRLKRSVSGEALAAVDRVAEGLAWKMRHDLLALSALLRTELEKLGLRNGIHGLQSDDPAQTALAAENLGYHANFDQGRQAYALPISSPGAASIVVALHGAGRNEHGLRAVIAYVVRKGSVATAPEAFFANYRESPEDALKRFEPWLEDKLKWAVGQWRETL